VAHLVRERCAQAVFVRQDAGMPARCVRRTPSDQRIGLLCSEGWAAIRGYMSGGRRPRHEVALTSMNVLLRAGACKSTSWSVGHSYFSGDSQI
jgi:hypothetical protein